MRKNTKEVFASWQAGKRNRGQRSIWTDGLRIYSYDIVILVTPDVSSEPLRLNLTKYSVTTTIHQRGLKTLLDAAGYSYVEKSCPL